MKTILLILMTTMTLISCSKKKQASFPDGAGIDLLSIEEYDSKIEELNTKDSKANTLYASSEYSADKKTVKTQIVNYESESTFFPKDIILTGVPNSTYRIKYKVTEKNLVLFKNAPKEMLSIEEQVLAEKESDGSLSLEIVTYDITGFYQIVQAKDDSGNSTSKLREQQVTTKAQATHFKISRVPNIKSLPNFKNILVKANFFSGSWYTSTVISKTSEEESQTLGFQVSYDSKLETADKVDFVKSSSHLLGMNSNYDKRIEIKTEEDKLNNLSPVISIPTEYFDFQDAKQSSKNNRTDFENIASTKNWKDREWMMIDFQNAKAPITETLKGTPILTNFKLTDDFFMFSLQFSGSKLTISFLRADSVKKRSSIVYQPKKYYTDDLKYFGYFVTEKKNLNTFEKYSKESLEVNRFLNRFHPEEYTTKNGEKRKRIRFVLTEDSSTDKKLIEVASNSLKSWDFAFKQVGLTDVDVYLDTSEYSTLGDIRYNSINMLKTLTSSSLFGYGPSISDPETGQIISATTNVHVTSIRDYIILNLRNYIRYKNKDIDKNYPLGKRSNTEKIGVAPDYSISIDTALKSKAHQDRLMRFGKAQCDFGSTSGNLIQDIESSSECQPLVKYAMSDESKEDNKQKCSGDKCIVNDYLLKCADSLLPNKIQGTMIHEIGHNLGLRHNFAASADEKNYARKSNDHNIPYYCNKHSNEESSVKGIILAKTSSVMEYTDFNEDRLTTVGPYDIEALRFGYANQLLTNQCKVIDVIKGQSIDKTIVQKSEKLMELKFCTDEHVEVAFDPLCQRQDSGSNPLEVVRSVIDQYNVLFATQNFKYDKAVTPKPFQLAYRKEKTIFRTLNMIYENWRMSLAAFVGEEKYDLGFYDANTYSEVLKKMENDPVHGVNYKKYFQASREIFDFYMNITFIPDRYCLIQKNDGNYDLIELLSLIKQVEASSNSGAKEISCMGKEISQLINKKGKFIRELGFHFEHQKAATDANTHLIDLMRSEGGRSFYDNLENKKDEIDSYWDIIGTRLDKDLAKDALIKSTNFSYFTLQKGIKFSIIDEPDLRNKFIFKISNRILHGIHYSDIFPDSKNSGSDQNNSYFPKWLSEKHHIFQVWNGFTTFSPKAGNDVQNKEKTKQWFKIKSNDKDKINEVPEERKIELKDGYFVMAPDKENIISAAFIKKLKSLIELQLKNPAKYEENSIEYNAQISLLVSVLGIELSNVKGIAGASETEAVKDEVYVDP